MKALTILLLVLPLIGFAGNCSSSDPPKSRCICKKVQKKAEREYKKINREIPSALTGKWLPKRKNAAILIFQRISRINKNIPSRKKLSSTKKWKRKSGKCFRWR